MLNGGGGGYELLLEEITKYYQRVPYKPKVKIEGEWVTVEIDTSTIISQESDYRKVVSLCEKGRFSQAKNILAELIGKNPSVSEYHRIYGQILSDEGKQEEAIDSLIEALRWDPKNHWALLMMGNIYSKHKKDIKTAIKFYDRSLELKPDDNITMNNIGAIFLEQGKPDDARRYFLKAVEINPDYPNTHFALGMIAEMQGEWLPAFTNTIEAIRKNSKHDVLYQNSLKQAFSVSQSVIKSGNADNPLNEYRYKLEAECGKNIELVADNNIPTAAKIEFAENYDRDKHIVRYKNGYPAVEHLIFHELTHLHLASISRRDKTNFLFVSNQKQKADFIRTIDRNISKLQEQGYNEKSIADYCSNLFEGINRQIFNAPVDLFIEDFLYHEYSALRPYQFISLYNIIQEGLRAVTDKRIVKLSPKDVLSKSKILNMVAAYQFRDFYGIDMIKDFQAAYQELKLSKMFYDEFTELNKHKKPGDEYRLILNWASLLQLDKYFELINEIDYRTKRTDTESLLESIGNNPFDSGEKDLYKERDMDQFQKSQSEIGLNMAVVMYMIGAMQYFEKLSLTKIKEIAMEIAMIGTQGIRPDKEDYRVHLIPDKTFSGYHLLAYYYISWKLAIPEMLSQLQLPFDKEYAMALTMFKPNKP